MTSTPNKGKRHMEDIATWLEVFSIYSLVLTSHFPHQWKDLCQYKLLILRTYQQFSNPVRLAYDPAFCEHSAATNLTNWSNINVQLFNFHAAGTSTSGPCEFANESAEPSGASNSQIVCKSWNRGRCSAPYAQCCFFPSLLELLRVPLCFSLPRLSFYIIQGYSKAEILVPSISTFQQQV